MPTEKSALQAAEDRAHEATKGTHPALSEANRTMSMEAASEYLGERFAAAYPIGERALLMQGRYPGRDFNAEFVSAQDALTAALNAEWDDGLSFGRWVERAAHRMHLK